ncbi:MAG: hypothetical protein P4M14_05330 [Gammaproteobacteria bacterium]|nr:hypothetical protein [Gammaproteobacteria bacterium]
MQRDPGKSALTLLAALSHRNTSDSSSSSTPNSDSPTPNLVFPSFHGAASARSSQELQLPLGLHSPHLSDASILTTEVNDEDSQDDLFDEQISEDPNTDDSEWFEFEDVLIHAASFQKGLIVIKPVGSDEMSHDGKNTPISHDLDSSIGSLDDFASATEEPPILIKDRRIYFSKATAEPTANTERAVNLLTQITRLGKTKRDLYVTTALPNPATVSQEAFVLIKTTFRLELYYKNAEDKLRHIPVTRGELQQVLNTIGLSESLKRPAPFKLQLSSGMLEILEKQITPYRKATLAVIAEPNSAIIAASQCQFVLTKTKDTIQLSQIDDNQAAMDLPIKSRELKQHLANIGITADVIDAATPNVTLTGYQLDKLEQLAAALKRSVYLDDNASADLARPNHDYLLIKKPGHVAFFVEQKDDVEVSYQPITASNIHTLSPQVSGALPATCYVKNSDDSFSPVNLNDPLVRKTLLKSSNLTLYTKNPAGQYEQIMESSSAIKKELNPDTVVVARQKQNGEFEDTSVSLKEMKKQLAQDQYELYYKNAEELMIKLDISSVQLKKHLTEFNLIEQLNKKATGLLTLSSQQLEGLDQLVKLYTAVTAYNQKRKDEVFVSLPAVGLYVQPWLSSNSSHDEFKPTGTGFKKFHTAGCLFGSTLKGVDQLKRKFPMVKHDICFYDNEVITSISFNHKALNPYEEMLFIELEKIAKFINMYADRSDPSKPPVLSYHLPYIDYILFGLSLLAIGRITFDALEKLFIKTFYQKNKHIAEVKRIYSQYGIIVEFESPFENLFDVELLEKEFKNASAKLSGKEKPVKYAFTKAILRMLNISEERFNMASSQAAASSISANPMTEAELTEKLLQLLTSNNYNPGHRKAWLDFLAAAENSCAHEVDKLVAVATRAREALREKTPQHTPQNMARLYTETCAYIVIPAQLKQFNVLYNKMRETQDDEAIGQFYERAMHIKKMHAICALHDQVKPLAVTQKEDADLDALFKHVCSEKNEDGIDALLAFGINKRKINSIEDIFKIGNPAMVGLATQSTSNDFETCSVLPASEKQIQVHYDKLKKELPGNKETPYRGVVNVTYIPTAICADNTDKQNAGLFFYYGGEQSESIARAIRRLMKYASENMALYAHSKSLKYGDLSHLYISLDKALASPGDSPLMTSARSGTESGLSNASFRMHNL